METTKKRNRKMPVGGWLAVATAWLWVLWAMGSMGLWGYYYQSITFQPDVLMSIPLVGFLCSYWVMGGWIAHARRKNDLRVERGHERSASTVLRMPVAVGGSDTFKQIGTTSQGGMRGRKEGVPDAPALAETRALTGASR